MELKIDCKKSDREVRIKIAGQINISNAAEFEQEMISALRDSSKSHILDFTELEFISSAGIRVLIQSSKELAANNNKLKCLLNAKSKVKDIFYLTGLYSVLEIKEL